MYQDWYVDIREKSNSQLICILHTGMSPTSISKMGIKEVEESPRLEEIQPEENTEKIPHRKSQGPSSVLRRVGR